MAAYTKITVSAGQTATSAWANHVQEQYDDVVAEIAAGNVTGPASMIVSGQFALSRLPRAASGFLKGLGTSVDPGYAALGTGDIPAKVGTLVLPAGSGFPRPTTGCADKAITELATNKACIVSLDFDKDAIEYAQFAKFTLPDGYTGGALTVKLKWTAASGSGTVIWGVQARCYANDEALDQAFGTAVEISDALITANDEHVTATGSLTPGGTPAGGESIIFQVYRKATDSGDTLTADAKLTELIVEYPTAYTD